MTNQEYLEKRKQELTADIEQFGSQSVLLNAKAAELASQAKAVSTKAEEAKRIATESEEELKQVKQLLCRRKSKPNRKGK